MVSDIRKQLDLYWSDRVPGLIEYTRFLLSNDSDFNHTLRVFLKDMPKGSKIIDMGTGAGLVAIEAARMGFEVDAMDYNMKVIDAAIDLSEEMGLDIDFIVGDVEEPELPEKSYDVVISRNCVWGLDDPFKAYSRWKQLLKPGG
ncbi:MAG: class I SAM-dependent methyltransferase [Candidatus Methanomethylophilaceae archaeon]|nr:class I SAM-dependent methyltransferase [Candidatus Methanomethylophilaceae archaeon]